MCRKIYLDAPNLGHNEKEYLNKTVDTGYVSTAGPFVPEFENVFSQYLGVEKSVSVQSGTAAIHTALYELGIGQGDEVIVPVLTFISTVNPVIYVGAEPVFIDVDINTWNISPEEIEKNITPRTKAIIPVHLYGNACNMRRIMDIAEKHNLYVIEDATESLCTRYKEKHTGTFGDFGCFSFNGNKLITTGGGGMIIGRDAQRLEHIKFLVNQARDKSEGYFHSEIGFNYRMTNIEAALGLAQMKRLDEFITKKKSFNSIYKQHLSGIKGISFQQEYEYADSVYWLTCVMFDDIQKALTVEARLKEKNIPARRIFTPLVEFGPYRKYKVSRYRNAYRIYQNGLCLPCSTLNSEDDIHYVCKVIKGL